MKTFLPWNWIVISEDNLRKTTQSKKDRKHFALDEYNDVFAEKSSGIVTWKHHGYELVVKTKQRPIRWAKGDDENAY